MKSIVMAIMATLAVSGANAESGIWTTQDRYGDFQIVVSPQADGSVQLAAKELQKYWALVTGHEIGIVSEAPSGPAIWIGADVIPADRLGGVDPAQFGGQELWIKTMTIDNEPHLLILGGKDQGTLYGVYQFIEDYLGVRWLAPGETYIPKAPASLLSIDYRYEPIFEFRYSTYFSGISNADNLAYYRQVHRWLPGPSFSCHTFYRLVPPEKYGKDHPEYYSLVNGKRVVPTFDYHNMHEVGKHPGEVAQICMSNPDVLQIIMQRIRENIKADPNNKVHHISQMDWAGNCECERCAALDEQEGTPMGSVLWGLNQIADMLAKEYPGHMLETLAYTYTRKPPKHMTPRGNIAIKLCSIECDFYRTFNDKNSKVNRTFNDDIDVWSKIAPRLHVWDYLTNFRNFQSPMPNFHTIQPNMQFLAEHRVKGMFPQGAYDDVAEFAPLRAYLLSKLMWNPYIDLEAVQNEFIDLYYQEAAPFVRDYITLLTERVGEAGVVLTFADPGGWYDSKTVAKAREIFDGAFATVQSNDVRRRLDLVYATVQCAALVCPPDVEISGNTITVRRPESQTLDEYFTMVKSYGARNIVDYFPLEDFLVQLNNTTPPRYMESRLITLENDRYMVWIAPALEGSILRWRDKKLKKELLLGYKEYGRRAGTWQDWTITPGTAEKAISTKYDVVSESDTSVTLSTSLKSGLALEKTVTLNPESDTVDMTLTFVNPTGEPLAPTAKIHPEFYTQGPYRPEVWAFNPQGWHLLNADVRPTVTAHGEILPVQDRTRLAVRIPQKRLTVFADFANQEALGSLLYFYNTNDDACHANIELIPANEPVQPGGKVSITAKYGTTRKRPDQL